MKATTKQLLIIEKQYSKMLQNLVEQMVEYRNALIAVVGRADLKTFDEDSDFLNLSKDAFMYKLIDLYEYNKTEMSDHYTDLKVMDSLMEDVKSILKKDDKL